ncbi:hypothetical protein KEM55_002979, partial [Ascosphaera atra]
MTNPLNSNFPEPTKPTHTPWRPSTFLTNATEKLMSNPFHQPNLDAWARRWLLLIPSDPDSASASDDGSSDHEPSASPTEGVPKKYFGTIGVTGASACEGADVQDGNTIGE